MARLARAPRTAHKVETTRAAVPSKKRGEMSFYIVFTVLCETLLIETFVTPAAMSLLGDRNWWPATMPAVTRTISD